MPKQLEKQGSILLIILKNVVIAEKHQILILKSLVGQAAQRETEKPKNVGKMQYKYTKHINQFWLKKRWMPLLVLVPQ